MKDEHSATDLIFATDAIAAHLKAQNLTWAVVEVDGTIDFRPYVRDQRVADTWIKNGREVERDATLAHLQAILDRTHNPVGTECRQLLQAVIRTIKAGQHHTEETQA